jgi:hypothetical protein
MESAKPNERLSAMRPNIVALMTILLAGAILGVAPFAFFIKSVLFFAVYIGLVIVITFVGIFRVKIETTATPTIGEYGLAALGVLCFHTIAGLIGSVVYVSLYWGTKLVQHAASWIGWGVDLNSYTIAIWPSVILTMLLGGIYAFGSLNSLPRALFSAKVRVRSTYYVMFRGRRPLNIRMFHYPVAGLVFCGIIALVFGFDRTALVFASQLFLFFVSLLPMLILQSSRVLPLRREVVLAMIKLANALGYKVIESPHTKDPEAHLALWVPSPYPLHTHSW